MNPVVRLLAVIVCVTLGVSFFGDIRWGWDGQPYSRAIGVAGLVLTYALLAWILCAGRQRASQQMRFSIKQLLFAITIVAALSAFVAWAQGLYYIQVRIVRSVLAEYPQIEKVWLATNEDVTLEVEQAFFSLAGVPGVILAIDGIDGASKSEIRERIERALNAKQPVQLPDWPADPYWPLPPRR
jgi:hypothetical protein